MTTANGTYRLVLPRGVRRRRPEVCRSRSVRNRRARTSLARTRQRLGDNEPDRGATLDDLSPEHAGRVELPPVFDESSEWTLWRQQSSRGIGRRRLVRQREEEQEGS